MTRPPDCTETGKDDRDSRNGVCGDSDTNHLDHNNNNEDIGILGNIEKDSS